VCALALALASALALALRYVICSQPARSCSPALSARAPVLWKSGPNLGHCAARALAQEENGTALTRPAHSLPAPEPATRRAAEGRAAERAAGGAAGRAP